MNVKRTVSLLLLLQYLLCGNSVAMDYTCPSIQKLKEVGAWYDPEPALDAPLDEDRVTDSAFWRKIKQNIQKNESLSEQDEKEIKKVCRASNNRESTRHVHRFNIAAALYIGVDTKSTYMQELLCRFVLDNDYPLVALMLGKGSDPNTRDHVFDVAVIFNAKTVAMAELLRKYGANFNVISLGRTLLHDIYTYSKTYELIPYYIKHGVNPMQQNRFGETALEGCIIYHGLEDKQQNIRERVAGFLEAGVSEDDLLAVGQVHQTYQPYVAHAIELYHKNK